MPTNRRRSHHGEAYRRGSHGRGNQAGSAKSITVDVPLPLLGVVLDTREAFHELCIRTGREVLLAMMEADREGLCGPKGRHQANRRAWRGGSTSSRVTLGGRQVELARLRVRSPQGEAALASFQWASATDAMDAHTLEAIAAGVSTRRYRQTLDPLPEAMDEHCVSRSAVSRRFVSLSRKRMHEFLSRPLAELDIAVVFVDAKFFREHCVLIALGVDSQGTKHVLGLREGSTENAAVARALLADLVERGLPTERSVLFAIDGAKALRRAIAEVYGERAAVQRCQVHKRRNVLAHLPEHQHAQVARCLHEAFESESAGLGERRLHNLARSLERDHPGAAASVREGLHETLTVVRLGLTGALHRTLRSTNAIENLNGSVERYTRNVKRWRGGEMIQRWVSAALLDAEQRFRRVRGFRDMPRLMLALDDPSARFKQPGMAA